MIRFTWDALRVMCQPCRAQTERLSHELDAPLSPGERFGLRGHLLFCRSCRRFGRQLALLRELARDIGREMGAEADLPPDVRARVLRRVTDPHK